MPCKGRDLMSRFSLDMFYYGTGAETRKISISMVWGSLLALPLFIVPAENDLGICFISNTYPSILCDL